MFKYWPVMGQEFAEQRALVKANIQADARTCKQVAKTGRDVSDAAKDLKVNKVPPAQIEGDAPDEFVVQDEAGTEVCCFVFIEFTNWLPL